MDYVRWILRLDFCTKILNIKGVRTGKVKRGKRALKFEEKIRGREENNLLKICLNEKKSSKKKDLHSRENKYFIGMGGH